MTIPVLIVDDSTVARRQLQRSLPEHWDISISTAANGQEAMAAIHAGKGELTFLDLTMPEMDGYQVLEKIRAEKLETTVIVVSADIQPEARRRVMELGALDFIHKPVDIEKLSSILVEYGLISAET